MIGKLPLDNLFWRFSLRVYADADVRKECLLLQDSLGINVNLLLFVAWLSAKRRIRMSNDDVAAMEALAGPWQSAVVLPLRSVRRAIKEMDLLGHDDVAALRSKIAAVEIESEQIEQALLFEWAARKWPADGPATQAPVRENITAYLGRFPHSGATTHSHAASALERRAMD